MLTNKHFAMFNPGVQMNEVTIETSSGNITLDVFVDNSPVTAAFFLDLVARDYYNNGDIYRATSLGIDAGPLLLQGGASLPFLQDPAAAAHTPMLEQIETTAVTGLNHQRGTLSLARDLNRTGHVIPEFFICLGDFPTLDQGGRRLMDTQGFPAFGEVTAGLEILDRIAAGETGGYTHVPLLEGQMLSSAIKIIQISTD